MADTAVKAVAPSKSQLAYETLALVEGAATQLSAPQVSSNRAQSRSRSSSQPADTGWPPSMPSAPTKTTALTPDRSVPL